jgi:hypothetical protein
MTNKIENVFIISTCIDEKHDYGATLVLDSIRVGFPDSKIIVINNAVIPKVKIHIEKKLKEIDGILWETCKVYEHSKLLKYIIFRSKKSTAIIDSDVIFWEKFDQVSDFLFEGRFIPSFYDHDNILNHPRIHPSLLKIHDPSRLKQLILSSKNCNLFAVTLNKIEFYDTLSRLYLFCSEKIRRFDENDLNKYDHLFGSTFITEMLKVLSESKNQTILQMMEILKRNHIYAKTKQYKELKGIWKIQEEYFKNLKKPRKNNYF